MRTTQFHFLNYFLPTSFLEYAICFKECIFIQFNVLVQTTALQFDTLLFFSHSHLHTQTKTNHVIYIFRIKITIEIYFLIYNTYPLSFWALKNWNRKTSIKIKAKDQMKRIGIAKYFHFCQAIKTDGTKCTVPVHSKFSSFCQFHLRNQTNSFQVSFNSEM